jgi:CRP/FNR family transcriptional regulator
VELPIAKPDGVREPDGVLARAPFCAGVPIAAVAELGRRATTVEGTRGATLYKEGSPATRLFVLTRGVVKLSRGLADGREVIVELAGPGDVIGEAALIADLGYGTTAVCVHPSSALAIPREDAVAFVAAQPAAVRNVVALLHAGVRRAQQRVEDMAIFGARQRIARFLLRLADWSGRADSAGVLVPLALSRQELAALAGTTVETAIRVMSELRRQGVVKAARRGFLVSDRAALTDLATAA